VKRALSSLPEQRERCEKSLFCLPGERGKGVKRASFASQERGIPTLVHPPYPPWGIPHPVYTPPFRLPSVHSPVDSSADVNTGGWEGAESALLAGSPRRVGRKFLDLLEGAKLTKSDGK